MTVKKSEVQSCEKAEVMKWRGIHGRDQDIK